jgi:hypothetical protein
MLGLVDDAAEPKKIIQVTCLDYFSQS